MNLLRSIALHTRYFSSLRARNREMAIRCERREAPISVLFYHRVADVHPNGWTLSKRGFVKHIDFCQRHFEIISIAEAQRRIATADSPRPAVAITFDDGYADNNEFALPMLISRRLPCTYFVATQHVRTSRPFAHDIEHGQSLKINTTEQILTAADAGIEIGAHTANHVDFGRVTTRTELESEIAGSKVDLESIIQRPVRFFAVPFGMPEQMRPAVFEASRRAGFEAVCSAYGAYNLVGQDPFHIRRIHGDPEFIRLRNWLSFDSRKVLHEPKLLATDVLEDDGEATNHCTKHTLEESFA